MFGPFEPWWAGNLQGKFGSSSEYCGLRLKLLKIDRENDDETGDTEDETKKKQIKLD